MTTMNISLPQTLKAFVDEQVAAQGYGSSSEYVRELIRKDRDRRALRSLLLEGAASEPGDSPMRCGSRDSQARPQFRGRVSAKPVRLRRAATREREAEVDVWRVLHGHRDLRAQLLP